MEEFVINLIYYTVIIAIVVFMAYYPKKAEQKRLKKMRENLKIGDTVMTYSGISGVIESIEIDYVIIKAKPDDVRIRIEKWGVAGIENE